MQEKDLMRRETERKVVDKVGEVVSAINSAQNVDEVICSLHSVVCLLFPIEPSPITGTLGEHSREQVLGIKVPEPGERENWRHAFYQGVAFPTLARFLLRDVASSWLACFPFSAQKHVYDIFFVDGLATEVAQMLVPFLLPDGSGVLDVDAIQSNAERLIMLCLLENNGVLKMAREFCSPHRQKDLISDLFKPTLFRAAQLVASVPDKARIRAPALLSSHLFFKQVTIQLLSLSNQRDVIFSDSADNSNETAGNAVMVFVGETFSRICRRGSADVLSSEIVPQILRYVQSILSLNEHSDLEDLFESNPDSVFWLTMIEVIKDPYSMERLSEQILQQLATQNASDIEAYWVLWLLYRRVFKFHMSVRSMFIDKFLLWKVFPISCLRWILQFGVYECPPGSSRSGSSQNRATLSNTVQNLVAVWSKRDFVQTSSVEQQAYISAAVGLLLGTMSKEELDNAKDAMPLILQGISCRLENPDQLIRKMASYVALIFSKVIDPENPLYLDDSCHEETIDWEFFFTSEKGTSASKNCTEVASSETSKDVVSVIGKASDCRTTGRKSIKGRNRKLVDFSVVDPDDIIDPATLNLESNSDTDGGDSASENSDSDSSLQPYDLADDDSDLKRKFSQLADIAGALRKADDADGVERALDVAEKLIRTSPDELRHMAADLARALLQVRCSDISPEGEEESAEEKRQRALVALLVTCTFESVDALHKLLYSPNVDISQRIMILDVMTEAAQELAETKIIKSKQHSSPLISEASETRPWFLPSYTGPPGTGSWKQISAMGTMLNWSNTYERELPQKSNQIKKGKTRRWSLKPPSIQENLEVSTNKFPIYAAAFILPAMEGFDKRRHGVDLLGRDFIVLGKLIHMLGVCIKSAAMHPEASSLAPSLLDMLRRRDLCRHKEAYVRRAVLFAVSCILVALHPSHISSALLEGNIELSTGLEWIRMWAIETAESDTDRECYVMATTCLQLHAEMALQTSRALESAKSSFKTGPALPSKTSWTIKIPYVNAEY